MTTQGRLSPMREVLGRFTFRLFQAQDLLNKAEDTLQQALNKYKTNQLKLQRREVSSFQFQFQLWLPSLVVFVVILFCVILCGRFGVILFILNIQDKNNCVLNCSMLEFAFRFYPDGLFLVEIQSADPCII